MINSSLSDINNIRQRLGSSVPFLLPLACLVFLVWSIALAWVYPDDGIRDWEANGTVNQIDPTGPSNGLLQPGDIIVSIDGLRVVDAFPFFYRKTRVGDTTHIIYERLGVEYSASFKLITPSVMERTRRLIPLLVAFIFWTVGVTIKSLGQQDRATNLGFLLFQMASGVLSAGQIFDISSIWIYNLYHFLLWIIGPLAVFFHLYFPQTAMFRRQRLIVVLGVFIGLLGGLPYIIFGAYTLRKLWIYPVLLEGAYFYLALNLLIVVTLLVYTYRHTKLPGVQGKIRLVVLGGAISVIPFVALTIIPEALSNQSYQPLNIAFLWLGVLPLTYVYAIFRYRLIELEKHINRGATYILVYCALGIFYLCLYTILHSWIAIQGISELLINTALVVILATLLVPVYRIVQRWVDTMFYGGWYDYRSAVTQITQGLEQITDMHVLAETVSMRLVQILGLEDTCIFLSDDHGDFSVIDVAPHNRFVDEPKIAYPVLPRSSLDYLLRVGDIERSSLARALAEVQLLPEERQLLNSEQVHLWVPILGHGQVQGLLALGPKFGGDVFSSDDMDILRVVARQIGPVIENIRLLNRLMNHAAELEKRVNERTAELHDAKERVEAILASVGDGVFVIDLEGNFTTVNKAFVEQSGYLSDEIMGKRLSLLLDVPDNSRQWEEIQASFQSGQVWSGELLCYRKDCSFFDIHLTLAPVCDQSGAMVSYVGSQRDITRRKELDRLKDLFVADVSHELRTPTTNINLYLELLDMCPPEKRPEYLKVVKEQSQLLRKLVEDILDLSRLAVGKTKKIEFVPVDLNLILDQVITAHLPAAVESGLVLQFNPCEGLPAIRGEQNQLSRLATNLVSNAVRYTTLGSVWVKTYIENGQAVLDVSDTGIGIDNEDIPHLFERFYRGKQVRQSKIHGTGLGLAIVKEIVDLHGGSITLTSEVGIGSRFIVRFPALTDGL